MITLLYSIGEMFDFRANDCKSMSMMFPIGTSRGGASYTIAPEIAFATRNARVELDYSKSDIWALGVVLATMHATKDNHMTSNGVMDSKKQLIANALPTPSWVSSVTATGDASLPSTSSMISLCNDLIIAMLSSSPMERLSCYSVFQRTKM
jgi:serine/threonine protein kinase